MEPDGAGRDGRRESAETQTTDGVSPVQEGTPAGGARRDVRFGALAIVLLVLAAFGPAMTAGFIWDDDFHLTENPNLNDLRGLKEIWTSKASIYYPLVLTTFWAMRQLVGLAPFAYHFLTIMLHAANALLLWAVLRRLNVRGAWLGAALFAVHPIQVDTAAWITETKNTQSTLFLLLSLLAFLRFHRATDPRENQTAGRGGGAWQVAAVVLFALALLSKTATVMYPVVLLLCLWWIERRWRWHWLAVVAPYFLLSAAAAAWTVWGQVSVGVSGGEWSESLLERILIAGRILWFYVGKILWPHPLMFIYPRFQVDPTQVGAWVPLLAAVLVIALIGWKRASWGRPLMMAAGCYAVQLFPVLWLFSGYFTRYSYVADHFQYLAGMAVFAALGAAVWTGVDRPVTDWNHLPTAARVRGIGAGLLLAVLCVMTFRHARVYHDSETLWRDTLAKHPDCWLARYQLANALFDAGNAQEAIPLYREALRQRPDEHYIRVNLADALAEIDQLEEAASLYLETLRREPTHLPALLSYADLLLRQSQTEKAIEVYERAVQLDPSNTTARTNLGVTLAQEGRYGDAEKHLAEAAALEPDSAEAHFNLGLVQRDGGNSKAAVESFRTALRLRPNLIEAAHQLARILATDEDATVRDAAEAVRLAEQLCALTRRRHPVYLQTLAAAYAEAGEFAKAVQAAKEAAAIARDAKAEKLLRDVEAQLRQYEAGKPHRAIRSQSKDDTNAP